MIIESVVVDGLVAACAVSAAWTLAPAGVRRWLALAALKLPLPGALATRLRARATRASSCGCDGCDRAPRGKGQPAKAAAQPITLHRRLPR